MTNATKVDLPEPIRAFQIGLEWFSERGGGLDRYYRDLMTVGQGQLLDLHGMVVGNGAAEAETQGRVTSFAQPSAPLFQRLYRARHALIASIADRQPDLIASHFALHSMPALDRIDRPLVVHFHGPWASEATAQRGVRRIANGVQRCIERTVYRRADRVIVLSDAFARVANEEYGVPMERIAVVPGSICLDRFEQRALSRQEARTMLGWPSDRRIMLSVRRLVPRMGLENLIEAMNSLVHRHPDVLILIIGKGPEHQKLAAQIDTLGLDRHIRLLGFVPDTMLPIAYRAADCSIVPTARLEGFGLIAAESLAAGTPVLVTPVGGLPEVVAPLAPALVLKGCGPDRLADGINDWAEGHIVMPDADRCWAYARENFSWECGIRRLAEQYRATIS